MATTEDNWYEDPEEAREAKERRESLRYRLRLFFKGLNNRWYDLVAKYWHRYHIIDVRQDHGPNTRYSGGYCDPCGLMYYACFAILVEFVEEEMFQSFVDWDCEEMRERKEEILALYRWWTVERSLEWQDHYAEGEELEDRLGPIFRFGKARQDGSSEMKFNRDPEWEAHGARWTALEAKEEEMFMRLAKIRTALWT